VTDLQSGYGRFRFDLWSLDILICVREAKSLKREFQESGNRRRAYECRRIEQDASDRVQQYEDGRSQDRRLEFDVKRDRSVMQYLIATYWMWFVVALLAGGAAGYWLPRRLAPEGGIGHLLGWGAAAFLAGLAVAVLQWFPWQAGPDPETLRMLSLCLLLSFWFALGGLLGRWLRGAIARTELERATLAANAQVESAVLGARAKAAVRSAQAVASTKAIEDARLDVEAKAAEVMRVAAVAQAASDKTAGEERLAAEAKAAEEARLAAAAKAAEKQAAEKKAAEKKAAEKVAEDARLAAEVKAADELRLAAVAKNASVKTESVKTESDVAAGKAEVSKAAEDVRAAAETRAAEEARLAAAVNAVQQQHLAVDAKASEKARVAAAAKAAEAEPAVAAATAPADASHPGSKPQGLAAPAEADDLKWIKGIGPRNEKACHALGIFQFRQIADWIPEEAIWVGHHMAFPGRVEREHWIAQARLLASGGETEHSRAVKSGAILVDDKADEPLDVAAAEMLGKSLPEQAASIDGERKHPGRRPYGLAAAPGKPDDLKRIRGIGPRNAGRLHELGIWHFSQVAAWTDENVKWVGSYLASSGRIQRDNWVAQARELVAGQETSKDAESSRRVAAGEVATPKDGGSPGEDNVQTLK
jgi:predicted flap endonuclease-1-like 5' DNA nuclease